MVPRQLWLKNLRDYKLDEMSLGDTQVHVYGDTAVVVMLYSQKGTVPGNRDISGNFLLTDIWIKTPKGWRVAERHSSRQEKVPAATRPAG